MAFVIKKIVPWNWPQNDLVIPNGFGAMPEVNAMNARLISREPFSYSMTFTNVPVGGSVTIIRETDADGDFWCEGANIHTVATGQNLFTGAVLSAKINIVDIRSGRDLTFPFARSLFYRHQRPLPIFGLGQRSQGRFIEPYCFTRNGGIKVTIQNDISAATGIDVHCAFNGWKEYAHASD